MMHKRFGSSMVAVYDAAVRALLTAVAVALVSGCGGGAPSSGLPPTSAPPATPQLVPTQFVITIPAPTSPTRRSPSYVTSSVASVTVSLTAVNGGSPPTGLQTSVTTTITAGSCTSGCTIPGPGAPPGSDTFSVTTYDANAKAISTATAAFTIVAGKANSNTITLQGIPAQLSISGLPSATAGTALSATALAVTVKDVDGNTITGTYATPIVLSDSDTSGATTIATSGSDSPPAKTLLSSSDTVTLAYTGLAISPATITAGVQGASSPSTTATFAPALQPITYTGPLVNGSPEIDLYATSGTGSSATFTAGEVGLTNSPYNKPLTVTPAASCGTIASVSPASGTSFTVNAVSSPAAGSCTLTIADGLGQSKTVTVTYTTTGFGVQ